MRTPCTCGRRAVPDRTYRVPGGKARQQCRRCRRLIYPGHEPRKVRRLKRADPEPETRRRPDRGQVIMVAATIFRAMPHLTNEAVYDRLDDEDMELPAYATWMSSYAPEARKLSGTKSVRGRPS